MLDLDLNSTKEHIGLVLGRRLWYNQPVNYLDTPCHPPSQNRPNIPHILAHFSS